MGALILPEFWNGVKLKTELNMGKFAFWDDAVQDIKHEMRSNTKRRKGIPKWTFSPCGFCQVSGPDLARGLKGLATCCVAASDGSVWTSLLKMSHVSQLIEVLQGWKI